VSRKLDSLSCDDTPCVQMNTIPSRRPSTRRHTIKAGNLFFIGCPVL